MLEESAGNVTSHTSTATPAVSYKFASERLATCWDDAQELTVLHHAEVSVIEVERFAPDRERYFQLDNGGIMRTFTARIDGRLVGYAIFLVVPHLHYGAMSWAAQDVLFVHPQHRGRMSVDFIRWMDRELELEGVECIHRHVTEKRDYSGLLESEGYVKIETGYMKRPRLCAS